MPHHNPIQLAVGLQRNRSTSTTSAITTQFTSVVSVCAGCLSGSREPGPTRWRWFPQPRSLLKYQRRASKVTQNRQASNLTAASNSLSKSVFYPPPLCAICMPYYRVLKSRECAWNLDLFYSRPEKYLDLVKGPGKALTIIIGLIQ